MEDPIIKLREIWPQGTVINGDYVIERRLGAGGFGVVYLARHRFLASYHVIKRLHENFASDEMYVRKFIQEGQVIRKLRSCPNIVEVEHMTQLQDGHLILVMEYVPEGDLDKLIKANGRLSVQETINFASQIANALKAAHAVGLIHRDIKPQNVLLSRIENGGYLAKVIDFGLVVDRSSSHSTTRVHQGSLGFAAPEQWLTAGKNLDGRTDLYALGASMYLMLAGKPPYDVDEIAPWLMQANTPPPAPGTFRSDVPPDLDRLILQMLAAKKEDRPPDAAAVIERLQHLQGVVPAAPSASDSTRIYSETPKRSRTWIFLPAVPVILGGIWLAYRTNAPVQPRVEPPLAVTPTPVTAVAKPTLAPTPASVKTEAEDSLALGDAAQNRGEFRAALGHFRKSTLPGKASRLEQLQKAVESDVEERVAAFSDSGQFAQADTLVDSWLRDFPSSPRLQKQKALIQRRRESQ